MIVNVKHRVIACSQCADPTKCHIKNYKMDFVFAPQSFFNTPHTHMKHNNKPSTICDMMKGNESLVENFNSYFLAPLSHNFNMLYSDPNP